MSRTSFIVSPSTSEIVVAARSSVHDTQTTWPNLRGSINVDLDDLERDPQVEITVEMAEFDAGDWLKNRKLRKDLAVNRFPLATFRLLDLFDVQEPSPSGEVAAKAKGTIDWRGRQTTIEATGHAVATADSIKAAATFELDVRTLGIQPPRFLMLKVEEVVTVNVLLEAVSSANH